MKAFLALRVSTAGQAADGISLGSDGDEGIQERGCRTFCEQRGWEVCGVFRDAASGRTLKRRPGVMAAIQAANEAKGVLLVYQVSRLTRRTRVLHQVVDMLERGGGKLASATENIVDTTTPMGRCLLELLAILAQLDSDLKGEYVKHANALIVERNKSETWPNGFRSMASKRYGWKYCPKRKTMVHVASEQRAISKIMRFRNLDPSAMTSIAEIARLMNRTDLRPRKAATWSEEMVRRIVLRAETPDA